jgi:Fur family ferric uptake transcriptional regulator
MSSDRKWRNRFKGRVSRWTEPREAVLELLSRTKKHMSAKEIYAALHKMYPGIGLTTIYRTLDLLERTGFLDRFIFGDGQKRYEFKPEGKKEHHHHLVCTNCGKIIDYSDFIDEELALVKKTELTLEKKYDFKVHNHNIEFYGLCKNCK